MDTLNVRTHLIINPGSASKKCALYANGKELCAVHLEKEGGGFIALVKTAGGTAQKKITASQEDYDASLPYAIALMRAVLGSDAIINIVGVGIRVVAPGAYFLSHAIIDNSYLAKLEEAKESAPLHVAAVLAEIKQARAILPVIPIAGISDSAFHKTMPAQARQYALPEDIAQKWELRRFGYHGISLQSALARIAEMTGAVPPRIIVCHLGSGASVTALKNGKSVDTSMGFTPLEGLPMGTRIGDIDAGAVLHLLRTSKMNSEELLSFFNRQCGLLGLSGNSADVRELIAREAEGDEKAAQALAHFAYHIKKYIGAYAAALDGIDLLIFTGTIGERSSIIRERICEGLTHLGIALDEVKNNAAAGADAFIERNGAEIKIVVIISNELRIIAEETAKLLRGRVSRETRPRNTS